MKSICVFCASSLGNQSEFEEISFELGKTFAQRGITLIYGGAQVGLMGRTAEGALSKQGKVIGIIPEFLKTKEIAHHSLTEMVTVKTMHERKAKMHEFSDGFIALPGGFGTMEELFEVLTWGQLSLHKKPIGVLNIGGYYDSLIELVERMINDGLLKDEYKGMLLVSTSIDDLLYKMQQYEAPAFWKWDNKEFE